MNYHISDSFFCDDKAIMDTLTDAVNCNQYVFRHAYDDAPVPGSGELGWHYHNCYELLYFLRGDADYQIQHNHYTLRPHSLLVIKPGEYHTMRVNSGRQLERIVVRFRDDNRPPEIQATLRSMGSFYSIPGTRLSEEILQVDKYCKDIQQGVSRDILISQLQIILSYLCNSDDLQQPADSVDCGAELIISFISNNLSSIHCLDDICKNVHMSRSTVQKLISDYLQTPIMSYVRTQKCVLARNLLQQGHSATEVCMQCGFQNYSTFYRAYRQEFGIPPSRISQALGPAVF